MQAQLSLEFLSGLVIVTIYLAAVFGFFGSLAQTLDFGVQKAEVGELASEIEFWTEMNRGDGVAKTIQLNLFPSTRLAIISENGATVVKSCSTATAATYEKKLKTNVVVSPTLSGGTCQAWPLKDESAIHLARTENGVSVV